MYSMMLESRTEQNSYTAELAAISLVLRCLSEQTQKQDIHIIIQILSVMQGLRQPMQQSDQRDIKDIYQAAEKLLQQGCQIQII